MVFHNAEAGAGLQQHSYVSTKITLASKYCFSMPATGQEVAVLCTKRTAADSNSF